MRRVIAISDYLESARKGQTEGGAAPRNRESEEREGRKEERERVMDCWRDCKQFVKLCK